MSGIAVQRSARLVTLAAVLLIAVGDFAFAQSVAPPLTNLLSIPTAPAAAPRIPTAPIPTAPIAAAPIATLPITTVPSLGTTSPAAQPLRPQGPDVLPSVERAYRRLRDARLPPSRCNYLGGDRSCAKLWVIDDWRTARPKRSKPRREVLRPAPSRGAAPAGPRAAVAGRDQIPDELLIEFSGVPSDAQLRGLARRYRLTRVGAENIQLIGTTIGLFRIDDRRTPQAVMRTLASDDRVRTAQPNFRYALQGDAEPAASDDPVQYALAKLRLPQAHALARGADVVVAVIDSGIDGSHPELAGALSGSFDPLGGNEGPHQHGTGIAGAIVAHAKLTGGAPAARVLAIRAFGQSKAGGQGSTSYLILKSLDYAAGHGARVVNMSFAGPSDPLIARGVNAAAARGIVMIAAAGNAGPASPPLYPAALPGVIAVSATDSTDALFGASNRGPQIAVAAPGVDILLPVPGGKYEMMTGTSFSAALVSGIAALMIERDPALKPEDVRALLMRTARDLGAPGRDDLFGAGEADAFAAVSAVQGGAAPAVATAQPAAPANAMGAPTGAERAPAPEPASTAPAR